MRIMKISDKRNFCYCKVRSLKEYTIGKKLHIKVGDTIYAMLYPMNKWRLFNTTEEDEIKQYELESNAKEGIDFEDITETTTQGDN